MVQLPLIGFEHESINCGDDSDINELKSIGYKFRLVVELKYRLELDGFVAEKGEDGFHQSIYELLIRGLCKGIQYNLVKDTSTKVIL